MYLSKRYLVTSALPYANGPLHIGHLAGAYLPADVYVRFLRLMGKDVVYICGSDEHGAAITIRASAENKSPKEIVDTYHQLFVEAFREMGISFDIYHRTSEPIHHQTSQEFFTRLYENGEFIEKESKQYFDKKSGKFLADRYIIGTCPKCGHDEAFGDQCEKCGASLSPTDLINPISTITGEKPILKKTKHWYLSLDKHEQWLREWLTNGKLDGEEVHDPTNWKNHVIGQCKSWLDAGLHPRAMTRDLEWGVDVPKEIPGSEGKKLYVWMDAPIGYISATKQWAIDHKKDWKPYWQDKDTALIHFIGKDNIVFHCLIFPAILKAHGDYILPENVPANQFVNLENRKISTSKNWAVWVNEYVRDFEGHKDELRYHLIKNMPEQKDSEFTWQGYQDSVNNELVNNLANFINRVLVLTHKYYKGVVPDFDPDQPLAGSGDEDFGVFHDSEMLQLFDDLSDLCQYIRDFDFRASLKKLMEISAKGNQLLQLNEPWKEVKENPEMVKTLMNLSLQIVTALSMAMRPFMPFTSDKLRELLNLEKLSENGEFEEMLNELAEGNLIIPAGHKINPARHLFVKVDDETIAEQLKKLKKGEQVETISKAEENHIKKTIQYNDFDKMDIRTATILEAEKVSGTDKLMKLVIDLGFEKRTVISGIATQFKTKDVIGKKVTYLANLASRKIRGIKSEGMILFAEDGDGKLSFIQPEEELSDGSVVR